MKILAHPASIGQFSVSPQIPGILIPDPSAPYTKSYQLTPGHHQITPGVTDDVLIFGNTSRQIRREADLFRFDHAPKYDYVPMNNEEMTLLRDPSNPGKDVEVAFHYQTRYGTQDPRSDLGKEVDLRTQGFSARTTITYSVRKDSQTVNSHASKAIAALYPASYVTRLLTDEYINLHLTGSTLSKFWNSHNFLRQHNPRDTASLAIAFSRYVFYEAGFCNSLEDGLYIVKQEEYAHRPLIARPFYQNDSSSCGLDGICFDDLKATIDGMAHPQKGIIMASRPEHTHGRTFIYDGKERVKLEMSFRAPDFRYGPTKGETHIDLTVGRIGFEHDVTLNDDLLLGIWRHIVDNVPS